MNNSLHSQNAAINTCIAIGLRLSMHSNSAHRFRTRPHFGSVHYHHSGSHWHFDRNTSLLFSTVEQTRKRPLLFCRTVHAFVPVANNKFPNGSVQCTEKCAAEYLNCKSDPTMDRQRNTHRSNRAVASESI